LEEVFKRIPIRDGMTLSFHHHFRNGDEVVNVVLATAAKLGIKGLNVALSAVFPVHAPLMDHIQTGVVSALDTNYMSGPVARAISEGLFARPVILRTHGGRARAIECGQLKIDVAFIAAPAADDYGNINGVAGPAACGSLGYAFPDAEYADVVVAVTDHLEEYPLAPISIPQMRVDYVVTVDRVGNPKGIVSGTTRITEDPAQLRIADAAAKVIQAAGLIKDGFSFQTGAGGASLATAHFVRQMMEQAGVTGSFILGGITGHMVEMLERGLFKKIIDIQGFDLEAVRSIATNPNHVEVGSSFYANPFNAGCAVNRLDCVTLGATEIDIDFNVNVVTGSNGIIMGGSGGHSDTAAGAKLTVIVANLVRGPLPIVVDRVLTATTPGETVDVLVTDEGVAVNPRRSDLTGLLKAAGLPVKNIHDLKLLAERIAGNRADATMHEKIVAIVEYRDGTIIDAVRQAMI
jgi:citrate lyase subunit alpha/citrate CoA-transferase